MESWDDNTTLPEDLMYEAWRIKQFRRLGFSARDIRILKDANITTHEAEDLIEAGCPPKIALEILV